MNEFTIVDLSIDKGQVSYIVPNSDEVHTVNIDSLTEACKQVIESYLTPFICNNQSEDHNYVMANF